jgi:hypothetical protein
MSSFRSGSSFLDGGTRDSTRDSNDLSKSVEEDINLNRRLVTFNFPPSTVTMKRRMQQEPDFSSLTQLDSLIIAQSVYETGASSWPAVAKLLSKHPLLSHPKSFFTAQVSQYLLPRAQGLILSSVLPGNVQASDAGGFVGNVSSGHQWNLQAI